MTIQARAFGRRLPWTALVPFADTLNHGNYQTKYDYDIGGNGMFRLFPTGHNHYLKGKEVFNSYGRRDNRFLLNEYGFCLPDNEWDSCILKLRLTPPGPRAGGADGDEGKACGEDLDYDEYIAYKCKVALLQRFYMQHTKTVKITHDRLCKDALAFLRVVAMSRSDFEDDDREVRSTMECTRVSMRYIYANSSSARRYLPD